MHFCPFCTIEPDRIIATNESAYAIRDGFPVTEGHTLIIPHRHIENYFGLTENEFQHSNTLLQQLRAELLAEDPTITGFNIGMNAGASAGQTIFHCHTHLIPRREGDVADPRGGVRGVIPHKRDY